ncbi:Na+-driven multidrug efflux pump [Bacteroides faecichinchillae]|uniref:Na+-driven multidrug efflux pump n=1 Tax=Bacteroides faecichinchillae TaxID=871325 RepID=A0A1M4YYH7_9BACE|nr:MATE family efflux transporter [Bacteroides faecichinchillae]SHF10879.1 Na+-driven multidrug efflux pump [Bacteroides faecichinchillae]
MQNHNPTYSENNKRIAKNTFLLYIRMLLLMLISLYTSRIVLNALGVENYGIYNVVGGVVAMFSLLSGSLSSAISRYITFELGNGDTNRLKQIFSTAVNVQLILIIIITILLETVGFWFLNYKMIIPQERLSAANWVFQFSIITFAVNLWSVPYNATIVAHERMSAFAYISIFDAVAKLAIAFVIQINLGDRLIYYGALVLLVGLIQRFLYTLYCVKHFVECKYQMHFDRKTIIEMFRFAGWNFIGVSSVVLRDQGGNILINMFFGPAVNAARGIAMSVNSAVNGFVLNFMTALNPQITKNYASGNFDYMFRLVFQGTRLSYYILLVLALPVIFTTPYLLHLWLGIVPEHASNFSRLVLIFTMNESLASPLITVMLATGKIKKYQLVVGGLQLLNLPLSYVGLKFGFPPEFVFVVAFCVSILCEFARLIMLKNIVGLSIRSFLKDVYLNVLIVTLLASILPFVMYRIILCDNLLSFAMLCACSVLSSVLAIYFIGCTRHDRLIVKSFIHRVFHKII